MTIEDTEALAAKMYAIYNEARGYMATAETGWDDLTPPEREGWIQVAQYVAARSFNHGLTQAQLDSFTFKTVMHTLSL